VNCGMEMQGNASRDNARTPKHSFRLKFKGDYGPTKLRYSWFPGPVDEFDTIVLRASGFADAWTTRYSDATPIAGTTFIGSRYRPETALYLRDTWVKDTLREMGHLSARSDFVHLYLNGLYWGIYNPSERLDAAFFAAHLGGREWDWDVLAGDENYNIAEVRDGNKNDWNQLMVLVNAGVTTEPSYQAVAQVVDIENLIDYMLVHIFAEAEDWPHHNWYAAHRRATNGLPATRWVFLAWDQEIVLDRLVRRDRVNVNNTDTPALIYSQLRAYPEFRRLFGDRVHKYFFNDGVLSASNNIARFQARAAQIDRAMVGESARWGDAREFAISPNPGTGQTFTRDEWWLAELQQLYTNLFQTLNATNLERFRINGLYPSLATPAFSQFGGAVPDGFALALTHTNASGAIFYTLDGSDPRQYGTGAVAPTAQACQGPITFNASTLVRARVLNGGQWSALVEAAFYPPQDLSRLALTEIMYNPPSVGLTNGDEFEFLELKNCGTNTLNLSGLTFSQGIAFTFTNGTLLAPGQFFVLARNAAAFAARYPGVLLQGLYSGKLDNGGETLTLAHPTSTTVFSVAYSDAAPWPVTPDGLGFSLVPCNPGLTQAPDKGVQWRASSRPGGSPGADDPPSDIPPIVINEVLTHTDPPQLDAVELFNPTATNVNVAGWYLTDDAAYPWKYRIPTNTIIASGGYVFFDASQFNPTPGTNTSFAFNSTGDAVYLYSAGPNSQLSGYSHGVVFGAAFNGVSFGRYVNEVGEEFFPLQLAVTLGRSNSGSRIGPLVINEIQYHPAAGQPEFIELLNLSSSRVDLFDPRFPTNTWKVGGASYSFPANTSVGPNGLLLLVATNPATFRTQYSVPLEVPIFGPFAGSLQDDGETLELQAPDAPNTNGFVPYVTVEQVCYNDKAPWPAVADGSGLSLQRRQASAYAN
ncbi:MAG TPA: lamin tail domain-containing protein, partial [Bacillota bacterium]|nr:lamin tail domain-containing protein [Bacillota bacterium]